jgi:peptidoglycan/LPS O-acetylase OafA/YrhL
MQPHGHVLFDLAGTSGGGLFGVQLFFVLSGFLITSILVNEWDTTGGIALGSFYVRRARRLLPALVVAVVGYLVYAWVVGDLDRLAVNEAIITLTYTQNIAAFIDWPERTKWLVHTWSLAVEEQFYLAWPLAFVALAKRRVNLVHVAVGVIVVTIVVRGILSASGHRIYEVTHWDALMVGCLLALRPVRCPRWIGVAALGLFAAFTVRYPGVNPTMFLVSAWVGVVLVAYAPRTGWMAWAPLRYFGRISYGLYLWHVLLLRTGWPVPLSIVASVVLADLSYRRVESPWLRPRRPEPVAERTDHAMAD